MATNDRKNQDAVTSSESGRPEPAPGSNDASHIFTDMPDASQNPDSTRNGPAQRPKDEDRVDISSADDVDVDKDIPDDDDGTPDTPPGPVRDGG